MVANRGMLSVPSPSDRLRRLLDGEIWPALPPAVRGKQMTKAEEEAILGYGPDGA